MERDIINTMKDKSLCGLIKFHSARLAEIAKDTEKLQANIDNEVAKAYQRGLEDGKWKSEDGCTGCKYEDKTGEHLPCDYCMNNFKNQWTAKDDKIEAGDEVDVYGDVKDFPLEIIIKLDANRIAAEMVHKAIDNTVWDEADYPGIKEKLHKVVDDYKKKDDEVIRELNHD